MARPERRKFDLAELKWDNYPVRVCRAWTVRDCEICSRAISGGESYHDGGPSRRAHVMCVAQWRNR